MPRLKSADAIAYSVIEIGFNDSAVAKGLKGLSLKFDNFKHSLKAISKLSAMTFGPLIYGLQQVTKEFSNFGDAMAKGAARSAVSVKWFSEMSYAATLGGQGAEAMEMALRGMHRATLDAARGQGEIVDALRFMGITTRQFLSLNTEQKFDLIREKLSGMKDASMAAGIGSRAMNRTFNQLLPLFRESGEAIDRMRQQARWLGISLDNDVGKKAEILVDRLYQLRSAVRGIMLSLGEELYPKIKQFVEMLIAAAVTVRQFVETTPGLMQAFLALSKSLMLITLILGVATALAFTPILMIAAFAFLVSMFAVVLDYLGLMNTGMLDFVKNTKIAGLNLKGWVKSFWEDLKTGAAISIGWIIKKIYNALIWWYDQWAKLLNLVSAGLDEVLAPIYDIYELITGNKAKKLIDIDVGGHGVQKVKEHAFKQMDAVDQAINALMRRNEVEQNAIKGQSDQENANNPKLIDLDRMWEMFKGNMWNAMHLSAFGNMNPTNEPNFGVPKDLGVTGFFGSQRISEMMGNSVKTIQSQMLDEQEETNRLLMDIEANTRKNQTAAMGA